MCAAARDGSGSVAGMKRNAARAALEFVEPDTILGVGSGSTVWAFIDVLAESRVHVTAAVAASCESARRLEAIGIEAIELGDARMPLYVDGADEIDSAGRAIKGGGAAHTREKLIATASEYWVCVVDASKVVPALGGVPVPLEVALDAVAPVTAAVESLGGEARLREGTLTDAGHPVLDATGLDLSDPLALEDALAAIPGVLGNGVFAHRSADLILVGRADGSVERIAPRSHDLSTS